MTSQKHSQNGFSLEILWVGIFHIGTLHSIQCSYIHKENFVLYMYQNTIPTNWQMVYISLCQRLGYVRSVRIKPQSWSTSMEMLKALESGGGGRQAK